MFVIRELSIRVRVTWILFDVSVDVRVHMRVTVSVAVARAVRVKVDVLVIVGVHVHVPFGLWSLLRRRSAREVERQGARDQEDSHLAGTITDKALSHIDNSSDRYIVQSTC